MNPRKLQKPTDEFELRLFRESGATIPECCAYFHISEATCHRVLRKLRLKMGPEKIKHRARFARIHMTALTAQASDRSEALS